METSVEANEEAAGGVSDMEQLGRRALPVGGLNGPVKYNIVLGVPPSAHTTSFFPQFLVHFPFTSSLVNQSSSRAAAAASCPTPSARGSSFIHLLGKGGGVSSRRRSRREDIIEEESRKQPRQSSTRSAFLALEKPPVSWPISGVPAAPQEADGPLPTARSFTSQRTLI